MTGSIGASARHPVQTLRPSASPSNLVVPHQHAGRLRRGPGHRGPGKPLAGKALLSLNLKVADTSPKAGVYPRAVSL